MSQRFKTYEVALGWVAAGSLAEVEAGLRLGLAWGFVAPMDLEVMAALADRLRAMLWRLTHARG